MRPQFQHSEVLTKPFGYSDLLDLTSPITPAFAERIKRTLQDGPLTEEGSAALDDLRVTLSRAARRRQADATADAGRLARQNWQVYRV
jgi:hypothetical protein